MTVTRRLSSLRGSSVFFFPGMCYVKTTGNVCVFFFLCAVKKKDGYGKLGCLDFANVGLRGVTFLLFGCKANLQVVGTCRNPMVLL